MGTPASSTNKTDSHDIAEILKVALSTITLTYYFILFNHIDFWIFPEQNRNFQCGTLGEEYTSQICNYP
jgi:hypothetical protein